MGLVGLSWGIVSLYEVVFLACPLALLGVGLLRGSLALRLACGETRPFGAALRIPHAAPHPGPLPSGERGTGWRRRRPRQPEIAHEPPKNPKPYRFITTFYPIPLPPSRIKYRLYHLESKTF
jgi:hypothetical protein